MEMKLITRLRPLALAIVVLLALGMVACGNPRTGAVVPDTTAAGNHPVLGTLEIHAYDFGGFSPAALRVEQPGRYTVKFVNQGTIPHNVTFGDGTQIAAPAHETKSVDV
jgi:plastocyanin